MDLDEIIQNNENGTEGGFYPVGEDNCWHSGIHVYENKVTPILSGNIISYRLSKHACEVNKEVTLSLIEYNELPANEKIFYEKGKFNATLKSEYKDKKDLFYPNFYLIKHSILDNEIIFYSLYHNIVSDDVYFSDYSSTKLVSDCNEYDSLQLPLTKKWNYTFSNSQSIKFHNKLKLPENCWFNCSLQNNFKLNEFQSLNANKNQINDKVKEFEFSFEYNDSEIKTRLIDKKLDISDLSFYKIHIKSDNIEIFQKESNLIKNTKIDYPKIGSYKIDKYILSNSFYEKQYISILGSNIVKDNAFTEYKIILPFEYLETVKNADTNGKLYYLRHIDSNEKIYRIKENNKISLSSENSPRALQYVPWTKQRKINDNVMVVSINELYRILYRLYDSTNNKYTNEYDNNKAYISNYRLLSTIHNNDIHDLIEGITYKDIKDNSNYLPITFNTLMKNYTNGTPKLCNLEKPPMSYAFIYIKNGNVTDEEINSCKIIYDGKLVMPIELPYSAINYKEFNQILNEKSVTFDINPDIKIYNTPEVTVYENDAFRMDLKTYDSEFSDFKNLKNSFVCCKRYIQNQNTLEYEVRSSDINVVSISGYLECNNPKNFYVESGKTVLYRNVNEKGSCDYASSPYYVEKSFDLETTDKILFNSDFVVINKNSKDFYLKGIDKEKTSFYLSDTDIFSVDDKIHFDEIPINSTNILGFPSQSRVNNGRSYFFDLCLFLNKNYMAEPFVKDISKKMYYFYKSLPVGYTLYKNKLDFEEVYLPKKTELKCGLTDTVESRSCLNLSIDTIPVFFENSLLKKEFDYKISTKPNSIWLDDFEVKDTRTNTYYCLNAFNKNYELLKNKVLEYLKDDRKNSDEYKTYYFTAEDLSFTDEFWVKGNLKIIENIKFEKNKQIVITQNLDNLINYNNNPYIEKDSGKLVESTYYIPMDTIFECTDIYNGTENEISYKLKLIKLPITIKNIYIKEDNVKFSIENEVSKVYLDDKVITKDSNDEFKLFADCFFNNFDNLKNVKFDLEEYNGNLVSLKIPADKIMLTESFYVFKNDLGKNEDWEGNFIINTNIKNINSCIPKLCCYKTNPLILIPEEYKIDKEIVIQNIDDNIALKDSSLTKYLRIILSDIGDELFIKESDADNYRDSALDWKKYFKICKTDTDDDIFCSLEDLESALELTSDEQNIFNSIIQNSISTSELIYLYSSSNSIYKSIADKLRTLVVTHVHELEKSAYDSISDKELKKYLQDQCEAIGIWSKIQDEPDNTKKQKELLEFNDNKLIFVHPCYFINHLLKAKMLEYNPFEGKSVKTFFDYLEPIKGENLGKAIFECKSNPGFAPYIGGDAYDGYGASITTWFNERGSKGEDDSAFPATDTTRRAYRHEGIDFSAPKGTPIHAFISGTVVFSNGDQGDTHFGKYIIVKADNKYKGKTMYFLLAHLDRTKQYLEVPAKFGPGDILGYVGNTGHCKSGDLDMDGIDESPAEKKARADGKGSHLHLQLHIGDWDKTEKFLEKLIPDYDLNGVCEKTVISRVVNLFNPFDYDDGYFNN